MTLPPPFSVTDRFSLILGGLIASVVGLNHVLGVLGMRIGEHLCRIGYRFRTLVEQVRAGHVPAERPCARAAAEGDAGRAARPAPASDAPTLPRRFRWLTALVPSAFGCSGQLLHLLDDPEMVALVSASPGLRRLFRSMFRMLGISPVPELIRLPPRMRRARAAAAVPPPPRARARPKGPPGGLLGIAPRRAWSREFAAPALDLPGSRAQGGFSRA